MDDLRNHKVIMGSPRLGMSAMPTVADLVARTATNGVLDERLTTESKEKGDEFDCQACGGCCAYSDTWPELLDDPDGDGIPIELIDCEVGRMKCEGDRCAALIGEVGVKVSCLVYAKRPSVCREFQPGTAGCKQVRMWFKLSLAV